MKTPIEELIEELVLKKACNNNFIYLNAFESGIREWIRFTEFIHTKEDVENAYMEVAEQHHQLDSEFDRYYNETFKNEISTFCNNCKQEARDWPDLNRFTCGCGALGYNIKK